MKRAILLGVLMIGAVAAVPNSAQARSHFSVGFGFPGPVGISIGGWHRGPSISFGFACPPCYTYYAPAYYYAAPPVYSPPVYYSAPAYYPPATYYYSVPTPYYYYGCRR